MEENNNNVYSKVPVKAGFWDGVKTFWLQPIVVELTPKQAKVFKEVHEFWNQEIHFEKGSIVLKKPLDENQPKVDVSL